MLGGVETVLGKRKMFISLVLGSVFSGIALYLAFRHVPLRELFAYIVDVNYWWTIPSIMAMLGSFSVRVIRWQLLLVPVKKVGFWDAFHPLMIGFALNCLLPARIGEVSRPAVFAKREKVPFFEVLATVGAERVFDLVVLLLFFAMVLTKVTIDPDLALPFGKYILNKDLLDKIGATTTKVALSLIAGIIIVMMGVTRTWIKKAVMVVPDYLFFWGPRWKKKVKERVCMPVVGMLDSVAAGFDLLKSPTKLVQCFLLSLIVWALSAVSYYMVSLGCPGVNISFLEMSASMIIICFFYFPSFRPWLLGAMGGWGGVRTPGFRSTHERGSWFYLDESRRTNSSCHPRRSRIVFSSRGGVFESSLSKRNRDEKKALIMTIITVRKCAGKSQRWGGAS